MSLSKLFADARPRSQKILYFFKQKSILKPFFKFLENRVIPGIQLHYLLRKLMSVVREDFRRSQTEVIYGAIRLIKKDDVSFPAWARRDFACIVFNLHVTHNAAGIGRAESEFRLLIDRAINFGGSFYLTYHHGRMIDSF